MFFRTWLCSVFRCVPRPGDVLLNLNVFRQAFFVYSQTLLWSGCLLLSLVAWSILSDLMVFSQDFLCWVRPVLCPFRCCVVLPDLVLCCQTLCCIVRPCVVLPDLVLFYLEFFGSAYVLPDLVMFSQTQL